MSENTNTEIVPTVANITGMQPGTMVTSFKPNPEDRATSAKIFNAMNNPGHRISGCINQTLSIVDYLVEVMEMPEKDKEGNLTGNINDVPRVVLVDDKGEAYQAVSVGTYNALKNCILVCGDAPWNPPVKLKVKQVPVGQGNSMLTFDMVG